MTDPKEIEQAVKKHPVVRTVQHLATAVVTAMFVHYQPFVRQEPIGEASYTVMDKRVDSLEKRMNRIDRRIDQILENQIRTSQGRLPLPAQDDREESGVIDPGPIHASNW